MVALLHSESDTLRLPLPSEPSSKGAERRIFPRTEMHLCIEGRRMDNTITARREPQLSLHLRDISFGGLSAISPAPLASGERLSVFFPQQPGRSGWDAYGRVIRCEPSSLGYRVAVEFDPLPAA